MKAVAGGWHESVPAAGTAGRRLPRGRGLWVRARRACVSIVRLILLTVTRISRDMTLLLRRELMGTTESTGAKAPAMCVWAPCGIEDSRVRARGSTLKQNRPICVIFGSNRHPGG